MSHIIQLKSNYVFDKEKGVIYIYSPPFINENSCQDFQVLNKSAALFFSVFAHGNTYENALSELCDLFSHDREIIKAKLDNFLHHYSDYFTEKDVIRNKKADSFLLSKDVPRIDYTSGRFCRPISLLFLLTQRCDKRCIYCIYNATYNCDNIDADMPLEFYLKVHSQANNMGIKTINYSGGEPLLYAHISELIKFDTTNGIQSTITTKGGVSQNVVKQICDNGLTNATISIDSPKEQTVDYLLGTKGGFRNLINTMDIMTKKGVNVRVNMVATKLNHLDVPEMITLCKEHGVSALSIRECKEGFGRHSEKLLLTQADVTNLRKFVDSNSKNDNLDIGFVQDCAFQQEEKTYCRSGKMTMVVRHDGKVIMCEDVPDNDKTILGDLTVNSISEIWNSEAMLNFISPPAQEYEGTACYDCALYEKCVKTQCIYNNLKASGRLYKGLTKCSYKEKNHVF